jgi:transcriptional regulator with XRE-family HTH domain
MLTVMSESSESLGKLIREQRTLARLSLRELAGLTKVSNAYLSQVERGIHEPSLRVLSALSEALNVPFESMVPSTPPKAGAAAGSSLEDAIRLDPALSSDEKLALLTIYRSMVRARETTSGAADEAAVDRSS